jgi:hypothetical protein
VDWPSYLRKVVSKTAVAAAGAAAGVAASAGGPIAMASAKAAAEKLSGDLLAQFMDAQADQMQRIEELSLEMRGRLIELQNAVGAQLDAPWHAALTHIEEAGHRPSHRARELELAKKNLIYAWAEAESLLERDPRSMDPAVLRCPQVAQQIAAVYSFLGEPQNTVRWLEKAYIASRSQLGNQISAVYDIFVQKMKGAKNSWGRGSCLSIEVSSEDRGSKDPLWVHAPAYAPGKDFMGYYVIPPKHAYVKRDLEFERRLAALYELDAEAQLLRLACLDAGANTPILRPGTKPSDANKASAQKGERRVLRAGSLVGVPWDGCLVVFDAMTAAEVSVKTEAQVERSPIEEKINDNRYRELFR